jgi:hypothetical protein
MKLLFGSLLLLSLFLTGCVTQVAPPAKFNDPVTVYYADYGVHSALLLPDEAKGCYVEFVFGDYAFSVLNRADPIHTLGALFCSFKSAFGRREHYIPLTQKPNPDPPPHKMVAFQADREKVAALVRKMNARYYASEGPTSHNPWNGVDYVPDAEHYSVFNSCNHLTLRNLRDLGYEPKGFPMIPNFRFVQPK